MSAAVFAAFISGLSGAAHCLGMCGGLAATLGLNGRPILAINYQVGRVFTYSVLGLIIGLIGSLFAIQDLLWLRGFAGVLMLLMAAYLLEWKAGLLWLERLGGKAVFNRLRPYASRFSVPRSGSQALIAGAFWGLLPCGLVYSMLALAVSQATPIGSMAVMFSFGFGTIPAMLATTLAGGHVIKLLQSKGYRRIAAASVAALGVYTLWPVIQQINLVVS
ncbi:sulfite exporter TauE/SafE family protein [Salinibius halmophilus]|uniref:sulfite exporter TauE/SafE family protein n=1 Tax=Salinibius halmophilus TaxID=1853216 RepID=UPI000E67372B|nr:sulfite exporter TauE/SafE family protein [Salinibius halmophilus]